MKALTRLVLITCCMLALGCASGEKYEVVAESFPAIKSGHGRLFFYRSNSPVGSAVQPDIKLNGETVGKSKPGGFFYADQPAGACEVMTSTEVKRKLTFTLASGETRYIKTTVHMGAFVGHIRPQLVDKDEAMKDLEKSKYIGASLGE